MMIKFLQLKDVLNICQEVKIPMVLDLHHHRCKNEGEKVEDLLEDVFNTWSNEGLLPKVHFSTPKDGEYDRKHADYIDCKDFIQFLDIAKKSIDRDFDVMIEAKKKIKLYLNWLRI